MKKYVEVKPICPFIGKGCIGDGWSNYDRFVLRPCAFWDGDSCNSISEEEPCRIKRAVNRILADEKDDDEPTTVEVPWDVEEGSKSNGKKAQK